MERSNQFKRSSPNVQTQGLSNTPSIVGIGFEKDGRSGKVEAVKVIEETVDETTGDARDRVVFNKSRDAPSKQKSTGDKKEKKSSNKKSSGKAKKKSRHSLGDLLVIIFLGTFSVVSSVAFVICFMSK